MPTYNDPTTFQVLPIGSFGFTIGETAYDFEQVEADSSYELLVVGVRDGDGVDRPCYITITATIYIVEASLLPAMAASTGTGTNPIWLLTSTRTEDITEVRLYLKALDDQVSGGEVHMTFRPAQFANQAAHSLTVSVGKGDMRPKVGLVYRGVFPLAALDSIDPDGILYNP